MYWCTGVHTKTNVDVGVHYTICNKSLYFLLIAWLQFQLCYSFVFSYQKKVILFSNFKALKIFFFHQLFVAC